MKKFTITVSVDEKTVCEAAETENVLEAVKAEAGWMHDSGIFVESVTEISSQEQ